MINPPPHSRTKDTTDSWITPKWLLDRLGHFDLDPCASDPQPWATAGLMVPAQVDGLLMRWFGVVWCNPPYGRSLGTWIERMAIHNNGVALTFARTDTRIFHRHVWPVASALLFLRGRLSFYTPEGVKSRSGGNSGGPSVLIAYGFEGKRRLEACRDLGALVYPRS